MKKKMILIIISIMILIIFFVKSTIIFNSKLHKIIDRKYWHLPTIIYGRILNLSIEEFSSYNKTRIIESLIQNKYRQVLEIKKPGEFIIHKNNIELLRRPFNFPDRKESQIHACLIFKNDILKYIFNLKNGRQFGFFRLEPSVITIWNSLNNKQKLFMKKNDFPDMLITMLLTTEDKSFFQNKGISFYAISRALLADIKAGKTIQGGSTITQQLVRNLFLTNKRTIWRKIKEIYIALLMNINFSKDQILEMYLNEIYLGQNSGKEIHGFPLASIYYFGRPINELEVEQEALLIAMVKGASVYNPWHNPKLALNRRNLILDILLKEKIINKALHNIFIKRPLGILEKNEKFLDKNPAFMQYVNLELHNKIKKYFSGKKIFSTLDVVSQSAADKAIIECIPKLRKIHNLPDLESAIIIVDRFTGEIRAIVGGTNPYFAGYNRAIETKRSIGSLVKPAIYLTALTKPNLFGLNTLLDDTPIELQLSSHQFWKPHNDNNHYNGSVRLLDALIHSINIPTVNLGISLGLEQINSMLCRLGISKNELMMLPSLLLGAINMTPIQVAQMYQTIASEGHRVKLSAVHSVMTINNDSLIYNNNKVQSGFIIPPQAIYLTLYCLQETAKNGTAHSLGMTFPHYSLAGKTGTTNKLRDSWFAGIDGNEIVIIWLGRDNNQTTKLYGSNGALNVYIHYLKYRTPVPLLLTPPNNILEYNINKINNINFFKTKTKTRLPIWLFHN